MMKIAPLAGAAWGADILTGQREFPVYKGKKDRGFKEVLGKEMERNNEAGEDEEALKKRLGHGVFI